MKIYQISYSLPHKWNYSMLHERIRDYDNYSQIQESSWIIATDQSATEIRDYLAQALIPYNSLLVTRLQGEAAWRGLSVDVCQWLKYRLGPHIV
jgi:hypothetical protein